MTIESQNPKEGPGSDRTPDGPGVETRSAETQTAETQAGITPSGALERLRQGNRRFVSGERADRDLRSQVEGTSHGQHPFAIVLGCIDSRVPPEVVFDQGIGDIFTGRVAGNVVGADQLGSMEFACKVAGARLVLVLGHTRCGAVAGALEGAELGNLTALLDKISPAQKVVVDDDQPPPVTFELIARVAEANVRRMVERIREESPVLASMEAEGAILIAGAMYEVETGRVRFLPG
jgi:carbonic anhydrase